MTRPSTYAARWQRSKELIAEAHRLRGVAGAISNAATAAEHVADFLMRPCGEPFPEGLDIHAPPCTLPYGHHGEHRVRSRFLGDVAWFDSDSDSDSDL